MRMSFGWFVVVAMLGADGFQPARLTETSVRIAVPPLRGQWQAAFDVGVDSTGSVTGARCLCGTPPLTDALEKAIERWAFEPASDSGVRKASRVLVGALFRPPTLFNVGPCAPPDAMLPASPELPVPIVVRPPTYPIEALGGGVVIVEVEIGPSGEVRCARATGDRSPFDRVAEQAAKAWHFLPGRRAGRPAATVAYLLFGFQEPALSAGPD